MTTKIAKKIVSYNVVKEDEKASAPVAVKEESPSAASNVVHMTETLERPEMLLGSTYKVKTPLSEHALYVTINDVILIRLLISSASGLSQSRLRSFRRSTATKIRKCGRTGSSTDWKIGGGATMRWWR